MDRSRTLAVIGVVVLVGVLAWWRGAGGPAPSPAGEDAVAGGPVIGTQGGSSADPARTLPTRTGPEPQVDEPVLAALEPGARQLRCRVAGLADGAWWARPAQARLVLVENNVLTAIVDADRGEVWLEQELRPAGKLQWEGQTCTLTPAELTTLEGTLHHADGRPAEDVAVRGCLHGEFARTDAQGRWSMPAPVGRPCHPMAFVEAEDGRFGKSNVVTVPVDGPVGGIALVLPGDEALLDRAAQRAMAARAAQMFAHMLGPDKARLASWEAGLAGLDGNAATEAEQRIASLRDLIARSEREQARLRDPEEAPEALRDAWLNLN